MVCPREGALSLSRRLGSDRCKILGRTRRVGLRTISPTYVPMGFLLKSSSYADIDSHAAVRNVA
jgi:hypothetical protein